MKPWFKVGAPKKLYMADIETDGLSDTYTKIWVQSITELNPVTMKPIRSFSITDIDRIAEEVADSEVCWVFHNGHSFDRIALIKFAKGFAGELIDTLGLSWYLYPKNHLHGLKYWGEKLGIAKPEVDDWTEQPLEVYTDRCEEDVKIQTALWRQMWRHLKLLYKTDEECWEAARHISGKMHALAVAEKSKWKLDVPEARKLVDMFDSKHAIAKEALEKGMPQVAVYDKKSRPKKPFKKDGDLSAIGKKWKVFTEEHGLDFDFMGEYKYQSGWKDPNANSYSQLKDWLFDMGWKPTIYDFKRIDKDKGGGMRKIPQLKNKDTGELCSDITRLAKKEPALEYLQEMGVLSHRSSVVGGFLKNVDQAGYIVAGAQGFTNTLRLRHKVALNIPSVRKPYGKEIRGLLVARNGNYELVGSDMASLEDRTKQHYMWPYDPEYVKDMMRPDFDPHCDMAVAAGMMTKEEQDAYALDKTEHNLTDAVRDVLGLARHAGKSTNYAATYGAGGPTIARSAGVEESVGETLHQAYWSRNWSLKAIADDCIVKESRGMKWLWNPVARMWFYLKAEKDRFSTLNQGTGAFVFDKWVAYILNKRPQINGQFHDEVVLEIKKGYREQAESLLKEAITWVNKTYKMNRDLDVDIDFGESYAQIH